MASFTYDCSFFSLSFLWRFWNPAVAGCRAFAAASGARILSLESLCALPVPNSAGCRLTDRSVMRPLTEAETTKVFEKLAKFIGANLKQLLDGAGDGHCFRLQKDRVYYVSDDVMRWATNVGRDQLASLGVCIGKFTHHKNFHLHVTCLDYIARYAKFKVWVKPSSEMSFLYGNHVLKTGLARITENTPKGAGVVVCNMSDVPIGFGLAARSTLDCRKAAPTDIIVLNQADVGMYLRNEDKAPASAL